jgi:glycosyltransferase involved in cell wall biosynthesis
MRLNTSGRPLLKRTKKFKTNKNMSKKLSVVIPVGEMAGRLEQLESSLRSSQNENIEWIVVHDHFDEVTCSEIDALVEKCKPKGRLIRLETEIRGVGNARNTGLLMASGDWICFIDSDDEAEIDQYWNMMLLAEKNNKNFAIGKYARKVKSKTTEIKLTRSKENMSGYLKEVSRNPGLWRWIIRRERLGSTIFDNVPMGEDLLFIKKLNPKIDEILPYMEMVYTYNCGIPGQATNNVNALRSIPSSFRIALEIDRRDQPQHFLSRKITFRLGLSTLKREPSFFVLRILAMEFINGLTKAVHK